MYTTSNSTREFALKAAAAAERVMERYACCKSQFKFKCFSCGEMINRGDKITRCIRAATGMTLRYRGADFLCQLTMDETVFYQGATGKDMWVHIGCNPCYWDSLPPSCNEYSRPSLRPICTEWGMKVRDEFDQFCDDTGYIFQSLPTFCIMKEYPVGKSMKDRIIHAVTRFQAIWRGNVYKKAYPIARRQARATEAINLNKRVTLSARSPGYRAMVDALAEQKFLRENGPHDQGAMLFDRDKKTEALYSYEILYLCGEANGLMVYVEFHHDGDRRKYHWKKFQQLRLECYHFMMEMGIHCTFKGMISTHRCHCIA